MTLPVLVKKPSRGVAFVNDLPVSEVNVPMNHQVQNMTLPRTFLFVHSSGQRLGIVLRSDQHRHLENNRTMIVGSLVDKMHCHGALHNLASTISRNDGFVHMMPVHPCSAKPRQGPRMNINGLRGVEPSDKLQPSGTHDKISLVFLNEGPVPSGTIPSVPILKRNTKCVRFPLYPSVWMVRNDPDNLSVKNRRVGSREFHQFLETGSSSLVIAARKDQNSADFPL
jgi:hypothetical protein